jgi:hypothetical protein
MESKNRTLWIILAGVVMVACCGVLIVAVVALGFISVPSWGWDFNWNFDRDAPTSFTTERITETFEIGATPRLEIDNFAGAITVRAGESDTIQVIATKKAPRGRDLDRVEVSISERASGLVIRTHKPSTWSSVSIQFEIATPAGTQLDVHTRAGSIEVRGLDGNVKAGTGAGSVEVIDATGEIEAHSGAGSINVRGAVGPVRLNTGAGGIDYQGSPQGDCSFRSGAGGIRLVLPADLNVEVDLDTGIGSIDVEYPVEGRVSRREVRGVIGTGDEGRIEAHTGTGSIDLIRR